MLTTHTNIQLAFFKHTNIWSFCINSLQIGNVNTIVFCPKSLLTVSIKHMQVLKLNVFHFSSVCTHNTENLTSRVEKTVYCKYPHTNTSVLSNEKKKPDN